ncbi:hypothetical protein KOM00_07040 [Geomonas sp. Red69]|uniref:Lipoprotein n=1 Tax=Geomonas diazotrophica TaxID=2843197 RepID=A0ABX8JKU3_9BACT|nr:MULTISPECIES: hypothetical protein [Geomonas]MBU5636489.1 hypothetical protein [Geomonas diazotrophica]QWV99008.1 hypothetical protein KP005_06925 [Geomonas nitrogeniifigens]QXE88174.1 hypothetical protein KP003_07175 [Geomonas nitrogeniifigens]
MENDRQAADGMMEGEVKPVSEAEGSMKVFQRLIVAVMLFLLTGCFQVSTVVRVNPDGSGTVEETMLLSKKVLAKLDEAMRGLGGGAGKSNPFDVFQPDALRKQAQAMGKGVTYHSGKSVETPEYKGYQATYNFRDINALKLPHRKNSGFGAGGAGSEPGTPFVSFHFKKGATSTLTMVFAKSQNSAIVHAAPSPAQSEKVTVVAENPPEVFTPPLQTASDVEDAPEIYSPPGQPDEKTRELVEMFMGMKFSLAVEVNGTILSTDATHRDGNRLTVFEMDMARLGSTEPSDLEKLRQMRFESLDEIREAVKAIPGIKLELKDEMTVVFTKNQK